MLETLWSLWQWPSLANYRHPQMRLSLVWVWLIYWHPFFWYGIWFGLLGRYDWPLPKAEWLCSVTGFMIFICTGTSIYNLAAINVNRLILITEPHVYRRIFTSWKLGLLVALPWVFICSITTIFILNGIWSFGYDKSDLSCGDIDSHKHADTFTLAQTLVALPLPFITIVVSYVWIYVYLKKHFHKQKETLAVSANFRSELIQILHKNTEVRVSTGQNMTSEEGTLHKSSYSSDKPFQTLSFNEQNKASTGEVKKLGSKPADETLAVSSTRKRETISRQQIKITKNLFIVVCAFFACFVTYFILNPALGSSHAIYYIRVLPIANSTINFVIYARKHPDFKVVLGCMMRCSYADIPEPSKLLKFLLSKEQEDLK